MSLSRNEIQVMIYQALLDMAEGGIDKVRSKYAEALRATSQVPPEVKARLAAAAARGIVREDEPLSDAVVTAVIRADRFIDAREVLEIVRGNAVIAQEPDERYKRRKVSMALYGQKGKALKSVKIDNGFVWGLPEWWDAVAGRIKVGREPIDDDGFTHQAIEQ